MKDKHNTKNKIIDAMYTLIGAEGYEKASMGKICDSIGITKAAAYYYFKSKEDIFLEIVKRTYLGENDLVFMDRISKSTTKAEYKDALMQFGFSFIDIYENDPELRKICYEIDIQTYRIPKIKEFVDSANREISESLIVIIEKGVALNLCDSNTVGIKSQYLQTLMVGLDKAILFEHPINAKDVWKYSINQVFFQEEV